MSFQDNKQVILGCAGVLLLGLAVFWAVKRSRPELPPIDTGLHDSIGRTLAEQTEHALGSGSVVELVPVCATASLPGTQAQVAAFEKRLKQGGKVQIAGREKVETGSPNVDGLLTPALYAQLLQKYPQAAAVVSFAGVGPFEESELRDLGTGKPPILAISMGLPIPHALVENGLVRVGIMPRAWADQEQPTGAVDTFSLHYQIVTP